MQSELILTHPGKAHFDEFFAISLILAIQATSSFTIERRDPTAEELQRPDIWVVDIGGQYVPELKNFDHHQDLELGVSFVLVATHLGVEHLLKMLPWWSYKDKIDRLGPVYMARELGAASLVPTFSPLEEWLVQQFAASPASVYGQMRAFGQDTIAQAQQSADRSQFWKNCPRVPIKRKSVLIGLTDESSGLENYNANSDQPADIAVMYDIRGEGWKLRRFDHASGVDFSRLERRPEISFAHKGGFIAKTRHRLPMEQVLALIAMAVE